jgi:DNA repair exonuclease SbcCD ATPase subunit
MDIQKFRNDRSAEISDFKKQYIFLKSEYSSALTAAIQEQDPAKQQELIQQVLSLNSSMTSELRDIIAKINQGANGFDPRDLNDLTKDLISYQKDYQEIEQSKDKVNTLKRILQTTREKLSLASATYNIYIALIVGLAIVITFLVFKTEWARRMVSTLPTVLTR